MASLQGVLASIPGLAGYAAGQQEDQQAQMQQLSQVGVLQKIAAGIRAQQEQQQLQSVVQQAGGNPEQIIQKLMASGNPKAIELATRMKATFSKPEGQAIGSGGLRLPDGTIIPPAARPKEPKEFAPPEFVKLQETAQKYPVGHPLRAQIEARLKMLQERPPGTTINMPASSDTVQGTDGKFYKFRIGKDGKPEVIPFQTPGGEPLSPPESAAKVKTRDEMAAEAQTLASVKTRIGKMTSLIQSGGMAGGVVGPLGMASRIGETAVGAVQPGAPTPALDYQNEMRLLLSDVRKMVEKDPNLSKDEREAMYETLGGGMMQTPGSALRTLNNIVTHVESKQRSGAGRTAGNELARQVKAAGWAYEPNKYEYRVMDGKVQRKAR